MRKLRELENLLVRGESTLAVVLVLTMLLLAGYNVVYRNVLVPLQLHWAHSGPPVERVVPAAEEPTTPEAGTPKEATPKTDAQPAGGDDFGGFGGAFDEGGDEAEESAPEDPAEEAAGDDFDGFGGDAFGEEPEPAPEPKPAPAQEPAEAAPDADGFDGFGGAFGEEDEPEPEPTPAEADDFGGFGGGAVPAADGGEDEEAAGEDDFGEDDFGNEDEFANLPSIDAVAEPQVDDGPRGGPPPEGSFAARGIAFIDSIKIAWIDVFLRQLVIMVAFLGATLATHRHKHINIDALSKVMPAPVRRVVPIGLNLFSLSVCLMLARAGWDLVKIGQEFPVEVTPWANEWEFQLMFPIGFGLLSLHFAIRVVESIFDPPADVPPVEPGAAVATAVTNAAAEVEPVVAQESSTDESDESDEEASAEDPEPEPEQESGPTDDSASEKGGQS